MKTVIIYDQCGQEDIKFFILEGDYRKFHNKYINSVDNPPKLDEELYTILYTSDGVLKQSYVKEFPVEAVRDGAEVVIIGFFP